MFYSDDVLDGALQVFRDAATPVLHLCSQAPATYAEASADYKLGSKTAPVISAQADRTGGGELEISFAPGDLGKVGIWEVHVRVWVSGVPQTVLDADVNVKGSIL